MKIDAGQVITDTGDIGPARVDVDGGVITAITPLASAPNDSILCPGFVDLQVNGIGDVDVAAASGAAWNVLDGLLVDQGVTTWCPTLITAPLDRYGARLERVAQAAARPGARPTIAGAHLEGPFLGGAPGAHRAEMIVDIDLDWIDALPSVVRLVTLAPEQHLALEAIRALQSRGVLVSLGHSTADAAQTRDAIGAGARMVTHLFNGMGPLHHRRPGLASTALIDDGLSVCLIADGVHVHPDAQRLAWNSKGPDRVVLVTDAVAWRAGSAGEVRMSLGADGAPRLADGTLAGSALTMNDAVLRTVRDVGVPLTGAVRAASTNPARLLGLDDRGSIGVGLRADLVTLSPDLDVRHVWIAGTQLR